MNKNNLTVFCNQIRNMRGKMAIYIVQDICSGEVEYPVDHWAWKYYQTFSVIEEYLDKCHLWIPSYYEDLIQ